jgi:aminoglycoside 3-N-acetyltransferase
MSKKSTKTSAISISKKEIKEDLKRIGLRKGDHVAVTLSLKSIGYVSGGPDAVIDALLEVIGSEGTLMMNTFTKWFPASEIREDYIFDTSKTPPYTGLVPTVFAKREGVIRSKHPMMSVSATGKLSEYLTNEHDEKANFLLPYEKLAKIDGRYLAIGIGNRLVAIRHEAQRRAGYFNLLPLFCGVKYKNADGKVKTFIGNQPPCTKNLSAVVPYIEHSAQMTRGKIGNAASILAPADKLLKSMTAILKEKPELTLCNDFFCLHCRALERKRNLYQKIENPKLFQKNLLIRKTLTIVQKIATRRYSHLSPTNTTWKKIKSNSIIQTVFRQTAELVRRITSL